MKASSVFTIIILISSAFFGYSQNKYSGRIISSEDKSPIPFANIWILGSRIGTTTNENGAFTLNTPQLPEYSKFAISSIGYYDTTIIVQDKNTEIKLRPKNYILSEIVVVNTKRKTLIINKIKPDNNYLVTGILYSDGTPTMYGVFFPYKKEYNETKYISQLKIRYNTVSGGKINLRVYRFDTVKCKPINEIVHENILVNFKKSTPIVHKDVVIELSKYNLQFPTDGLFIAIEYLIIPENEFIAKFSKDKNGELVDKKYFGPNICIYNDTTNFSYEFKGGIWEVMKFKYRNKLYTTRPLMSLKLTD